MFLNKIGIKITSNKPKKLSKLNDSRRYCNYIGEARDNRAFYIQNENISCPLARYNLGLEEFIQKDIKNLAKTLVNWNDAETEEKALNYLKNTATLDYSNKYISIYPLNKNYKEPDLVILIGTPDTFMPLIREICKEKGEWGQYFMSGVGGMCAETTAIPLSTGKSNVSLGCGGSRPHARLKEGELLIGMPYALYKKVSG
ncbi:MAG: DUF169 domain-containing protein [Bacillota bacterium]